MDNPNEIEKAVTVTGTGMLAGLAGAAFEYNYANWRDKVSSQTTDLLPTLDLQNSLREATSTAISNDRRSADGQTLDERARKTPATEILRDAISKSYLSAGEYAKADKIYVSAMQAHYGDKLDDNLLTKGWNQLQNHWQHEARQSNLEFIGGMNSTAEDIAALAKNGDDLFKGRTISNRALELTSLSTDLNTPALAKLGIQTEQGADAFKTKLFSNFERTKIPSLTGALTVGLGALGMGLSGYYTGLFKGDKSN